MFDMIIDFIGSSEEAIKRLEIDIKSVAIEELVDILYSSIENQLCNSERERLQQIARCKIIKGIQEKLMRRDRNRVHGMYSMQNCSQCKIRFLDSLQKIDSLRKENE